MTLNLVVIILVLLGFYLYHCYVQVIRTKNSVDEALADIDVQLTKRDELIPQLTALSNQFLQHESDLMKEITALRTDKASLKQADNSEQIETIFKNQNQLGKKLSELAVNLEAYPDLKSEGPLEELMHNYKDVENDLAAARRFYNSSVANFKNACEIFPGSLFAKNLNIRTYPSYYSDKES